MGWGCWVGVGMDGGGLSGGGALLGAAVAAELRVAAAGLDVLVAAGLVTRCEGEPPAGLACDAPFVVAPAVPAGPELGRVDGRVGALGEVVGAPDPSPVAEPLDGGELVPAAAAAGPDSGPASATVTTPVAATASAAVPAVAASTSRTPRSRRRPAPERRDRPVGSPMCYLSAPPTRSSSRPPPRFPRRP